jgi:predicted RNA-binding Zn-ribbon protein involved in translation (DUF1610 family)
MSLLDTLQSLFGRSSTDSSEYYPWECPHCNMAIGQDTKDDLVTYGVFFHCPACGESVDVMREEFGS